jgi:ATP/maltotriose-dependent transcriptional regulator MalT
MGEVSYYTVKSKSRLARVLTWSAAVNGRGDPDEAEQLAREAAVDGLRYDEQSPGGNYDAYFRAIWAQALLLRGDAASLRLADDLLVATFEARRTVSRAAWCDAFLWLTTAQLRRAQGRPAEAGDAIGRARAAVEEMADPTHPIGLALQDFESQK